MGEIVLILGGARSGKSSMAEQMATVRGGRVAFIATAEAYDEEMQHRIGLHRSSRPSGWRTIEEPLDLDHAVRLASRESDVVVIDCLTLWVSNHLCRLAAPEGSSEAGEPTSGEGPGHFPDRAVSTEWPRVVDRLAAELEGQISDVVATARSAESMILLVSNEVGLGLVPPNPLSRAYRDLLGVVNRRVAAEADQVLLMVAGLPVDVKRLAMEQG